MVSVGGVFTAGFRHRASAGTPQRALYFVNAAGTPGGAAIANVTDATTSYADAGPNDVSNAATYRPGGGSWVLADFDDETSIFARVHTTSGIGNNSVVTSVWGQIEYVGQSGGFTFLLQLAGLGALPFVGAMDFQQFLRYLSWRRAHHPRHTLMRDRAEILRAWDEVKSYRHPRFFYGFAQ